VGAVVALMSLALLLWGTGAAGAATIAPDDQGWWSEAQQAPSPLPVDTVTGQNLQVGGDPTGPNAVAALRFIVPGTIDGIPVDPSSVPATLTLKVAPNTAVGKPVVTACPVLGGWQPVHAGTWTTRPAYNCDRSAAGVFSADGATATFKLDPALQARPGVYDLALAPPTSNQAPFSVQFLPPGADSLALGTGSSAAPPPADAASTPAVTAPSDFTPVTAPPIGAPGFDVGAPLPLDVGPTARPAARPARPSTNRVLRAPLQRAVSTKRSQQAVALGLLGALALGLWWFGGQQARAPRLLGSLGEGASVDEPGLYVPSGGIGRFARPRTRPPARL
jgi:hypothetical protein